EAVAAARRMRSGGEQPLELTLGQPVRFLSRLRRPLELDEGIREAVPAADPLEEPSQEPEAAVVGGGRRAGALLVGGEIVDDRRFLEDAAAVLRAPVEEVVDRDPVGGQRAGAASRRLQASKPVAAGPAQVDRGRHRPRRFGAELRQDVDEEGERIDRLDYRLLRRPDTRWWFGLRL